MQDPMFFSLTIVLGEVYVKIYQVYDHKTTQKSRSIPHNINHQMVIIK